MKTAAKTPLSWPLCPSDRPPVDLDSFWDGTLISGRFWPPIILPRPDMRLSRNRIDGRHWAVRQAAKVKARDAGRWAAKEWMLRYRALLPLPKQPGIFLLWRLKAFRADRDNLDSAAKPMLDGVAQVLGIDDRNFWPAAQDRERAEREALLLFFFEVRTKHDR